VDGRGFPLPGLTYHCWHLSAGPPPPLPRAVGSRPHKGPAALGVRLQQTLECRLPVPGSVPAQLSAAGAWMTTLPQEGGGGGHGAGTDLTHDPMTEGDRETCFGVNMELVTELQQLVGSR